MDKEKLKRYIELKDSIRKAEAEIDELKPLIVSEMEEEGKEELVIENMGKFYFTEKRKWKYPFDIVQAEKKLKEDKKTAERVGTAESETIRIFNFRFQDEQGNEDL